MRFIVPPELDGTTVRNFLRRHCNVSARTLAKLKRTDGGITSEGRMLRSIDILSSGETVELKLPEDEVYIEPVELDFGAVYEDEYILAADKPAGMPVHPVGNYQKNTLANAVAFHAAQKGEAYVFRPVNRIDKDTSGLVLIAKDRYTAAFLQGHCKKTYYALCEGMMTGSGTIDLPMRIKEGHTIMREVCSDGVRAVTHYRVIKNYGKEYTLLEIVPETGRTHQIRTHFSSLGHALAGDDMYGGSREHFMRQCLHCGKLEFVHPVDRKTVTVKKEIDFFDEYR